MPAEKTEPRSPIKEPLPRLPGQSGQEKLDEIVTDLTALGVLVIFAVLVAGLEWLRWAFNVPPSPVLATVAAVGIAAFAFLKYKQVRPAAKQEVLGIQGEQSVAETLGELGPSGYRAFHDILGDGFNIDHALIGPTGVYAIETKARTKKGGAEEKVVYDGTRIFVNGHVPDRDPLAQAEANVKTLAKILKERTGITVAPRGVVLFPGWWVEEKAKQPKVWVLCPKRLRVWLSNEPNRLSADEIRRLADGLTRHQQTEQRVKAAMAK